MQFMQNTNKEPDQREVIMASVKDTWKKVPSRMATASVQDVIAYKKQHSEMHKFLGKRNLSMAELVGALNKTNIIYGNA
jgi:hypothetical protein